MTTTLRPNTTAAAPAAPPAQKKTQLPAGTTRKDLLAKAQPVAVTIDGRPFVADARLFSSTSVGWNINDKGEVTIDGVRYKTQIGVNITIVGTKDLPPEA